MPVYVFEKDDGSAFEFPSVMAIQQHLEAIDVENGEYEAWDASGHCLELGVGGPKSDWLKIVLTDRQAPEAEFTTLKERAEKRREFAPREPLSRKVRRWFQQRTEG